MRRKNNGQRHVFSIKDREKTPVRPRWKTRTYVWPFATVCVRLHIRMCRPSRTYVFSDASVAMNFRLLFALQRGEEAFRMGRIPGGKALLACLSVVCKGKVIFCVGFLVRTAWSRVGRAQGGWWLQSVWKLSGFCLGKGTRPALQSKEGQGLVFGCFHYFPFAGTFVIDATQVKDAMDNYPVKFPIVRLPKLLGIGAYRVQADE